MTNAFSSVTVPPTHSSVTCHIPPSVRGNKVHHPSPSPTGNGPWSSSHFRYQSIWDAWGAHIHSIPAGFVPALAPLQGASLSVGSGSVRSDRAYRKECHTVACTAGFPYPEYFDVLLTRGSPPSVQLRLGTRYYNCPRYVNVITVQRHDNRIRTYST